MRQKKTRDFFVKIFQKVPKNGYFDLFFQKFENLNLVKLNKKSIWFGRPKKRSSKFLKKILKIRPPRENLRSTPGLTNILSFLCGSFK